MTGVARHEISAAISAYQYYHYEERGGAREVGSVENNRVLKAIFCVQTVESHLLQNRATEQTIGVRKLLRNLKVIVPLHDRRVWTGLPAALPRRRTRRLCRWQLRRFGGAINQGLTSAISLSRWRWELRVTSASSVNFT